MLGILVDPLFSAWAACMAHEVAFHVFNGVARELCWWDSEKWEPTCNHSFHNLVIVLYFLSVGFGSPTARATR